MGINMLGNIGFSYVGLIYLLFIFIPNIIWSKNQPSDYNPGIENKTLLIMERIGQVLCTTTILVFSDTNPKSLNLWFIWFILSVLSMIMYEGFWFRYFKGEHTMKDFYHPYLGVPYPGATLPVFAFLFLGIYAKLIPLLISSTILAIGHIGIHIQHYQKIKD